MFDINWVVFFSLIASHKKSYSYQDTWHYSLLLAGDMEDNWRFTFLHCWFKPRQITLHFFHYSLHINNDCLLHTRQLTFTILINFCNQNNWQFTFLIADCNEGDRHFTFLIVIINKAIDAYCWLQPWHSTLNSLFPLLCWRFAFLIADRNEDNQHFTFLIVIIIKAIHAYCWLQQIQSTLRFSHCWL